MKRLGVFRAGAAGLLAMVAVSVQADAGRMGTQADAGRAATQAGTGRLGTQADAGRAEMQADAGGAAVQADVSRGAAQADARVQLAAREGAAVGTSEASADGSMVIDGSAALRAAIAPPATALRLVPLTIEGGCGPQGCGSYIERLLILRDEGRILRLSGGPPVRVAEHRPAGGQPLPDLDWTPLHAFEVYNGRQRWGTCLHFTHEGLGKSGRWQRWSSVMLLPYDKGRATATAHRMTGYLASCELLQTAQAKNTAKAAKASQAVALPLVEPTAPGSADALRLVRYQCEADKCTVTPDPRRVMGQPLEEKIELRIEPAR